MVLSKQVTAGSKKLSGALRNLSINPSKVDPCVFIEEDGIILIYVDDCFIFLQDKDKINQLIDKLKNKEILDLTDEGDVEKYLGVDIERNKEDKSKLSSKRFSFKKPLN